MQIEGWFMHGIKIANCHSNIHVYCKNEILHPTCMICTITVEESFIPVLMKDYTVTSNQDLVPQSCIMAKETIYAFYYLMCARIDIQYYVWLLSVPSIIQ